MSMIEVEKVKTEYRAVEFDGSGGSDSFVDVNDLFYWAEIRGHVNFLDEDYLPNIEIPVRKPTYPGQRRAVYVKHGDWIVASSRGKVKVMTAGAYHEKFKEKK